MASQSAIGICYALQLLPPEEADSQTLLKLLSDLEKKVAQTPSRVLGGSATNFIQETRAGKRRRSRFQNIPGAVIGLARTAQLLEGHLSWEDKSRVFGLCLNLLKMGEEQGICVGDSALGLMREVFAPV